MTGGPDGRATDAAGGNAGEEQVAVDVPASAPGRPSADYSVLALADTYRWGDDDDDNDYLFGD